MQEIKINSSNLPIYVGIIMTLVNLYHSYKTSKKTQFINTVTTERIRWITSVREATAEYYSAIDYSSIGSEQTIAKKNEVIRITQKIKLYLNFIENKDIIELLESTCDKAKTLLQENIYEQINSENRHNSSFRLYQLMSMNEKQELILTLSEEMDALINNIQIMLKSEWDGVKDESENGRLSYKKLKHKKYVYLNRENILDEIFLSNLL